MNTHHPWNPYQSRYQRTDNSRLKVVYILIVYKYLIYLNYISGKGTYKWKATGCLYDGDWKGGKRNGFGTYSLPQEGGGYKKQYSGGWKNDKRHVSC